MSLGGLGLGAQDPFQVFFLDWVEEQREADEYGEELYGDYDYDDHLV